jgi:hypothetical protein
MSRKIIGPTLPKNWTLSKIRVQKRLNRPNRKSGVAAEYSCFLKTSNAGIKNEMAFAVIETGTDKRKELTFGLLLVGLNLSVSGDFGGLSYNSIFLVLRVAACLQRCLSRDKWVSLWLSCH